MDTQCFVCNGPPGNPRNIKLFESNTPLDSGKPLINVLSELLDKTITEKRNLHSNEICVKCYRACKEFDDIHVRLNELKTLLTDKFKDTLKEHSLDYDTYNKTSTSPGKLSKPLVLSKSKLVPLPPGFVFNKNIVNTTSSFKTLPSMPSLTIGSLSTSSTTYSSITSEQIVHPTNHLTDQTIAKSIEDLSTTSVSIISNILSKTSSDSLMDMNVNTTLPKDFLTFTSSSNTNMKLEPNNFEFIDGNHDDQDHPMEIDEDCAYTIINTNSNDDSKSTNQNEFFQDESITSTLKNIGIRIIQEGDDENGEQNSDDQFIQLSDLRLLQNKEEDDGQAILIQNENGSIVQLVSGRKLMMGDGDMSLLVHDEDDDQREEGQDSNDESNQIELQVSGDEETANAIIAAASEHGGAFIKIESGEMYRVKAVKTETEDYLEMESSDLIRKENSLYKCVLCENLNTASTEHVFEGSASAIMSHLRYEHNTKAYLCKHCDRVSANFSHYLAHLEAEHGDKPQKKQTFQCDVCNKNFYSRAFLEMHMNRHKGAKPFNCEVCSKGFSSKYSMIAHRKTHSERPRPFQCRVCLKGFLSQSNLLQHQQTHEGRKDFICKICDKGFVTAHSLEVHGVVHTGKKPFACSFCAKSFARKAELGDHTRTHTGERPFACDICGSAFSQRSNLLSHRRLTHLNERRYECDHCHKKFKRRRLLEFHIKSSHTGERPLQCGVCSATFVYPEHYKKHARIHSGEKPYVCEVCGKGFNTRDNRNTHRFVHSAKKPYECLLCGAGYMRKHLLYAHINASGHFAESIVVNQPRVVNEITVLEEQSTTPTDEETSTKPVKIQPIPSQENTFDETAESKSMDGEFSKSNELLSVDGDTLSMDSSILMSNLNSGVMQVVEVKLPNGKKGWVALNT